MEKKFTKQKRIVESIIFSLAKMIMILSKISFNQESGCVHSVWLSTLLGITMNLLLNGYLPIRYYQKKSPNDWFPTQKR
jgi:hypothetical protein